MVARKEIARLHPGGVSNLGLALDTDQESTVPQHHQRWSLLSEKLVCNLSANLNSTTSWLPGTQRVKK